MSEEAIHSKPTRICVVTGSRAEYGLLSGLMRLLQHHPLFELTIVATGMHLSPEYGLTYRAIEADGFAIDYKVELLLSSDTAIGTVKSIGLGLIGFADAFAQLRPDWVILFGDRYEIFAAAGAAYTARIPIAHIAGGDTTEGSFDEGYRHAISKMAQLHFPLHEQARERLIQMGEHPDAVITAGHPGIDLIAAMPELAREEVERQLAFRLRPRNLLITYHPATLDSRAAGAECQQLLDALGRLGPEVGLIFTLPNSDPAGRELSAMIERFAAARDCATAIASLGNTLYYNTARHCDAVVGNSSSGIYEIPALAKPTVNIGNRQRGRLRGNSVIQCEGIACDIAAAIDAALAFDCTAITSPYGTGRSAARITATLLLHREYGPARPKCFYNGGQKSNGYA